MPSTPSGTHELTSRITLSATSSQVLLLPTDIDGTSLPSSVMARDLDHRDVHVPVVALPHLLGHV
jgi:hypothetical protein